MELNEYQQRTAETAIYDQSPGVGVIYCAMMLAGESGEYVEKIAKALYRNHTPLPVPAMIGELGDILWYLSQSATELGYTLEEVATINLVKLQQRKADGTLGRRGDTR